MIKCIEIKDTKNPDVKHVGFEEVKDEFQQAIGYANNKKAWVMASKDHTFAVGKQYNKSIKHTPHDEPQYEGHEAFEKTGKYYTSEIV